MSETCLPILRAIDILDRENEVRHHDQDPRFNERTTDIEWVSVLGKDVPTWVVLSGDGAILKNRAELKALKEAKLTYFCMSNRWSKMKTSEYAWRLIKIWPDIRQSTRTCARKSLRFRAANRTRSISSPFNVVALLSYSWLPIDNW